MPEIIREKGTILPENCRYLFISFFLCFQCQSLRFTDPRKTFLCCDGIGIPLITSCSLSEQPEKPMSERKNRNC